MAEKTVKTDDVVHEELERRKQKYGVETFNEVLRRMIGIDPGPEISKLTAYLNEELTSSVKEVIAEIEEVSQFERGYEKARGKDYLTFIAPETDRKVADISFKDGIFQVRYRDSEGNMEYCGKGYESTDPKVTYGTTGSFNSRIDLEDVRDSVSEKVEKANDRWSQE